MRVRVLRRVVGTTGLHVLLLIGLVICLLPLVWTVSSAFKNLDEIFDYPPHFIPREFTLTEYTRLFEEFPMWTWIGNSLFVAIVSTVIGVFLCAMCGFGFAKYTFRGKSALFAVLLSSMMIPFAVLLIPLFKLVAQLGWADSYQALIVPWVAPAFGVFMMRQFTAQAVSDEMLDAGRIDGATEFGLFWRLALPVLRPALAALSIWLFLTVYNSFLWPLIVVSSAERQTLPVGLAALLNTLGAERGAEYGLLMAGSVVAMAPTIVLFIALRKQFIEGLTLGSVKG